MKLLQSAQKGQGSFPQKQDVNVLNLNAHFLRASSGDDALPSAGNEGTGSSPPASLASRPVFVVPKSTRNPLFDQTSDTAIRTAHRRKWTSILTLVSVVSAAIGVYAWSQTSKNKERALTKEFILIQGDFGKEQEAFQESQKKLGKDADFTKSPDHGATAQKFFDFAKKYAGEPLATQAALRATSSYIETKDWDKATDLLAEISRKTLSNSVAQSKIKLTQAKIWFEKGDLSKALIELDFAIKLKDNPVLDETKLLKAQVLYFNNQQKEAGELLRELANSPSASLADMMGGGGESQVASEASLWLGHWGL